MKIEKVERTLYGAEFFTEDKESFTKALAYLKRIGITDVRSGIVTEPEVSTELVKLDRKADYPVPTFHLYAILRGNELGYIGSTTQNPPSRRVDEHLKKAAAATDPFIAWLAEGYKKDDIKAQYWQVSDYNEMRREETLAIRKLRPIFNIRKNGLALPTIEDPDLFKSLHG